MPSRESKDMAFKIRRVEYFHTTVVDQPGEAYKVLSALASLGVNLLAFTAVPVGPDSTQLTLFPEDRAKMVNEAKKAGMALDGPHRAILLQGDDELGALAGIHRELAHAGLNVVAATGVADGRGAFGSRRSTIGSANASVLPEPVRDRARTSCPAMPSGTTIDWIAKGSVIPLRASAPTTGADTPRLGKDCCSTVRLLRGVSPPRRCSGGIDRPETAEGGTGTRNLTGRRPAVRRHQGYQGVRTQL